MDHGVRDLDQIQEREGDDRGRRIGTILLATAAVVGLTFAIGVVVGRAAEPEPQSEDPLARLERQSSLGLEPAKAQAQAREPALPKVEPANLSFPTTLSEQEDRPEVIAALEAAAAEDAALGNPSAERGDVNSDSITVVKLAANQPVQPATADDAPEAAEVEAEEMVASIPAAVAAGEAARSLPKTARHDPLVAAAMRNDRDPRASAPRGYEGEYTLQVISYDHPEPSQAFAEGLRAKGHMAFVTAADIPDRGKYFRVRIGPFKTKAEAEGYRKKFEDDEHMNTFVVRVKDDEPGRARAH